MSTKDLGLHAVERAFEAMQIDAEWSVREARGFTWWGAWVRERIWADKAVRSRGETLWHVRACTPALRDVPDEPATYDLVNTLNGLVSLSAYAYDPEDRTISAGCGTFLYRDVVGWLEGYFVTAAALGASVAWGQVPPQADGRALDDAPHPASGPRKDPDDMLNLAGAGGPPAPPIRTSTLRRIAKALADEGAPVAFNTQVKALEALVPLEDELQALWGMLPVEHPLMGWGLLVRLLVPRQNGPRRAAWLANALNLAEAADWRGEIRPHALGAWTSDEGTLVHHAFFPGNTVGDLNPDAAAILVRSLLAWGMVRARFAGERLPWLDAAAASRYPDDEPPEGGEAESEPAEEEPVEEPEIPLAERSFGPNARTPRPRPVGPEPHAPRELVVDPADPDAYPEIDDAVAAAEDGYRIRVRPGTYRKPVVIDRAVAIEGDGDRAAIILEPFGGECLGFAVSGATVGGLTIRPSRAGNDGADYSAVSVRDVSATIERCDLTSHLGATVWVGGPSSLAIIRGCALADGAQNGVYVGEEGRAELIGSRVRGHRWSLMVGGPHASLRVIDCEITDNLDDGIAAAAGAVLVVERTAVTGNAGTGVLCLEAAPSSSITDSAITGNGGPGIAVRGGRGIRVARNRVARNAAGIIVDEGASPALEENEVADNADVGIGVTGDMTDPLVTGNAITSRRPAGIVVRQGAAGTFERNRLAAGDAAGIWVADDASCPVFRANTVSGGEGVAVRVSGGGGGTFESNDLRGNAGGSWELEAPGELHRTGNLEDVGRQPGTAAPSGAPGRLN